MVIKNVDSMAADIASSGIASLTDALRLLNAGEHFVLTVSNGSLADELRPHLLRFAGPKGGLVYLGRLDPVPKLKVSVVLSGGPFSKVVQAVKQSLNRLSVNATVLFDLSGFSEDARIAPEVEFLKTLRKLSSVKKFRTLWLIREGTFHPDTLADLKSETSYYLAMRRSGRSTFAQFLSMAGTASPEMFLPHSVFFHKENITFEQAQLVEGGGGHGGVTAGQYKEAFENASAGMFFFEWGGDYKELNARAREALGYDQTELAFRKLIDVVEPRSRYGVVRNLLLLKRKGKHVFQTRIVRKSGRFLDIEISASLLGRNTYIALCRDIGNELKDRESATTLQQEYDSFVSHLPYPYAIFANRKLVRSNQLFNNLFPWAHAASPSVSDFFGRRNADLLKEVSRLLDDGEGANATNFRTEVLIPAPERKTVATEVTLSVVQYEGKRSLYCTFVDISERRAVLDKAASVDEKFRALFEGSLDGMAILQDGTITSANRSFAALFGAADPMEVIGRDLVSFISGKNSRSEISISLARVLVDEAGMQDFRYTGKKSDGTKIEVEARAGRIDIDGKPALLTHHRDVSQAVQTESEIARKAKGLEILNRISDELAAANDINEIYKRGMHAAMKGGQLEAGAVFVADSVRKELVLKLHHNFSDELTGKLVSQSLDEGFARFFGKTQEPLVVTIDEYPPYLHYKSLFEGEGYKIVAFLPLVSEGEFFGVLLLCSKSPRILDEVEKALFGSCGRLVSSAIDKFKLAKRVEDLQGTLENTLKSVSDVLYAIAPSGTFVSMSPNIEKIIGFAEQDFLTNAGLWRTLLHPDDRPVLSQRVSNQTAKGDHFVLEYRILPKGKASYIWLRDTFQYVRDASGNVIEVRGLLTDITHARRVAELETAVASGPVSTPDTDILQRIAVGVAVFDEELVCIEWNDALHELSGVPAAAAIGEPASSIPVFGSMLAARLAEHASSDQTLSVNYELDGVENPLTIKLANFRDGQEAMRTVVTFIPSSQESRGDDVQEAEEVLRSVINTMQEALLITGLDGEVWEVNHAFRQLTGFGRESVRLTHPPYPWMPDADSAQIVFRLDAVAELGVRSEELMTWKSNSATDIHVAIRMELLRDASGSPAAALWIAQDVGERQKLFSALEAKNRQVEVMNSIISFANTSNDISQIFDRIVAEIRRLIRFDGVCLTLVRIGNSPRQNFCSQIDGSGEIRRVDSIPVDSETVDQALSAGLPTQFQGSNSQVSVPVKLSGQSLGAVTLLDNTGGEFSVESIEHIVPIADQIGAIVSRLELFEQVRDDAAYIHNLLNSIESVVYTVDKNYVITQVNKAWHEFALKQGLASLSDETSIVGQSLSSIIPTEEQWHHYKTVMEDLFARRIESYATDSKVLHAGEELSFHLVIRPMVIGGDVTSLVFTYTDVTVLNRSEAEIKRRNKALIALNAISSSISKSLDLDQVLTIASKEVSETFDAGVVMFFLGDNDSASVVLAHQLGVPEDLAGSVKRLHISGSLVGRAIRERLPVYVSEGLNDDQELTEGERRLFQHLSLHSGAVVPLHAKENTPGAFLISWSKPRSFAEDEQQLLMLIGSQIAAAIDNAKLYAEIQRQVKTLTTLYELGKGLTGALDLRSMLQIIYREVSRAIPLDRFYYQAFLPDQKKLSLLNRIVKGVPEYYPSGHKQRALEEWPNTIYQHVVENGTSYIGSTSEDGYDSMIAVPIRAEEHVVGVISVVSSQPERYNSVHLRLLESIANLAGVAVGKASLYEDTLKKATEIENRNKDLDDFTYVVSHDLKEPLISIEGYSKIVMKDYAPRLDDEGREYLGSVVQSVNRMKHLIDDLLTLSRLGRMQESYEPVDVRKIISEILHDFQFSLKEKNVTVHVGSQFPTVQFSSTRLSMVFRNLISNAMKFNDKPEPVITIDVAEDEAEYVFKVSDNGIGIDPQYYDRIFTIFQRLKRSEEYRGTGAGLTIAKKIVEREGGRIWVESVPGEGATFYFTIAKTG